jgi:hypothetical protein
MNPTSDVYGLLVFQYDISRHLDFFIALLDVWMEQQGYNEKLRSLRPDSEFLVRLRNLGSGLQNKIFFEKRTLKGDNS